MFKKLISISVLCLSVATFAGTPDFSVFSQKTTLDQPGHGPQNKLHECMKNAWVATAPSDDQNSQAKEFMGAAHIVIEAHKDALHSGMRNIFAAWAKHPVSKEEVSRAEQAIAPDFQAVREAVQDAQINIINLLSQDQRNTFDQTFMTCMHQ